MVVDFFKAELQNSSNESNISSDAGKGVVIDVTEE